MRKVTRSLEFSRCVIQLNIKSSKMASIIYNSEFLFWLLYNTLKLFINMNHENKWKIRLDEDHMYSWAKIGFKRLELERILLCFNSITRYVAKSLNVRFMVDILNFHIAPASLADTCRESTAHRKGCRWKGARARTYTQSIKTTSVRRTWNVVDSSRKTTLAEISRKLHDPFKCKRKAFPMASIIFDCR